MVIVALGVIPAPNEASFLFFFPVMLYVGIQTVRTARGVMYHRNRDICLFSLAGISVAVLKKIVILFST